MLGAADQYVRLYSVLLQELDRVLGRLRLQLLGRTQVGHQGQVNHQAVLVGKLPLQLPHGLDERQGLDVSDGTAYLGDDHVVLSALAQQQHAALDLVGDVGDDLDGLAQVRSLTLLVDDCAVDLTGGDVVRAGCVDIEKSLIMTQVQVGLGPVLGDKALSVLVGIQRAGVHVEIGVELLDSDPQSPGLKQLG